MLTAAGYSTVDLRVQHYTTCISTTTISSKSAHENHLKFKLTMWNALKVLIDEVDEQEAKDLDRFAYSTTVHNQTYFGQILPWYRATLKAGVRVPFSFRNFSENTVPGSWSPKVFGKTYAEFWPSLLFIYHCQLFGQSYSPLDTDKKNMWLTLV